MSSKFVLKLAAARGKLRIRARDLFFAFLLGCSSWFVLMPVWNHAPQGGLLDKLLGGLFSPAYRLGKHLAHVIFPNNGARNTTGTYIAPVMGVVAEVLFLMALWTIAISLIRWRRCAKHRHDQDL
jgi:hypothetical protein